MLVPEVADYRFDGCTDLVAGELFDCRNDLRQGVAVIGIARPAGSLSEAGEMA